MCIKGPESWWIAKSITPQLMVNQSKINPQLPSVLCPLISTLLAQPLRLKTFSILYA